jgi:hypothetical protein
MPTLGNDLLTAFKVWWDAASAEFSLASLLSDGQIHHLSAPENTLLPYATLFKVSDTPELKTTGGFQYLASLQVNVHAQTDAQAQSIADQIAASMRTLNGYAGPTPIVYGAPALMVFPEDFGIEFGEGLGPNGQDCWVCHFTVSIRYFR